MQTDNPRHTKINTSLQPERYFSTVYLKIESASALNYLHNVIPPLQPYCHWIITYPKEKNSNRNILHISLRYLGYTDEIRLEEVKGVNKYFRKYIDDYRNLKDDLLRFGC